MMKMWSNLKMRTKIIIVGIVIIAVIAVIGNMMGVTPDVSEIKIQ